MTHDDDAARVFKMGREDKSVRYLLRPLISADHLTASWRSTQRFVRCLRGLGEDRSEVRLAALPIQMLAIATAGMQIPRLHATA